MEFIKQNSNTIHIVVEVVCLCLVIFFLVKCFKGIKSLALRLNQLDGSQYQREPEHVVRAQPNVVFQERSTPVNMRYTETVHQFQEPIPQFQEVDQVVELPEMIVDEQVQPEQSMEDIDNEIQTELDNLVSQGEIDVNENEMSVTML